ncbi:MAG: M23 family metallopeptidase [Syntrophales bacterium]|nr:M23 family metallopeptidase [Syntrophales bacterium]
MSHLIMSRFTALALCLLFLCLGCATTERVKGTYHRVQPNETLSKIAREYNTTPEAIARANNIDDINVIERDRVLFIPQAGAPSARDSGYGTVSAPQKPAAEALRERPMATPTSEPAPRPGRVREETLTSQELPGRVTGREQQAPAPKETVAASPPREGPLSFLWPFSGSVTSSFGPQQGGTRMNGISIESKTLAPVKASEEGTVLHSAPIKFYGETIIIRHSNNYLTIYAQLQSRSVKTGDTVSRGDAIGMPGKNEDQGNHGIYFEMRRNNRPIDPMTLLRKR